MAKILFIGDIVGKPGRKILSEVLPQWKEKYQPDVTIVNVENMAHGKGVTINTMNEISQLGIDVYTSGNHVFDKGELSAECFEKFSNLIRPGNFGDNLPGHGYFRFSKNGQQYLVLNLNANVFMENQFNGPIGNAFLALDKLLVDQGQKNDIILVDFHSEATSEKIAFGLYADGRVTGVFGTHTHVPTADARVLPKGTAYISDTGMTGPLNSVLGVKFENVIKKFLDPVQKFRNEPEETGPMQINAVLVEVSAEESKTLKAQSIEQLHVEV